MTRAVAVAAAVAALLATAPTARAGAGEPIMGLSEVHAGMHCTARSVVQGTAVSTFDADVLDVLAGDRAEAAPRILVRVSGPAVAATGVGPGFSGSPISCAGGDGTERVIGAISEGIGAYGGDVVLATPIEAILGEDVDPPAAASSGPAAARMLASARPMAAPLSISGLSGPVARAVQSLASRAGRTVLTAPAAPRVGFAPAPMVPGAAMAVGLSTGDLTAGAIGTVSYVDGDRLWAFGHPLEAVGRRSLFLQDAYVYAVVNNPLGFDPLSTYKLAAPGHDIGTISADGINAVAGHLGTAPPSFPLEIVARDLDRGRVQGVNARLADETAIGLPSGASALSEIGPLAVAQATFLALGSSPARQSTEMCFRVRIHEARKPLRFCNRSVGIAGGAEGIPGGSAAADVAQASALLDAFDARELHIERVHVNLRVRRGLQQAFLVALRGPRTVRRGHTVRLRAQLRRPGGALSWRTIDVRIPRWVGRGRRDIALVGTPTDPPPDFFGLFSFFVGSVDGAPDDARATIGALGRAIAGLHRFDGVRLAVVGPGSRLPSSRSGGGPVALQPEDVRISGQARLPVRVK